MVVDILKTLMRKKPDSERDNAGSSSYCGGVGKPESKNIRPVVVWRLAA